MYLYLALQVFSKREPLFDTKCASLHLLTLLCTKQWREWARAHVQYANVQWFCFQIPMVGPSVSFTIPLSVVTSWECQGTPFRYAGKMICIKRSIKDVPSCMSTARVGAIPSNILVFRLPRRRCSKIRSSNGSGCFVALRIVESLFRIISSLHFSSIME